jgi:hypothetical protein
MIHSDRSSYTTDTCNDLSGLKYCATAVIRIKGYSKLPDLVSALEPPSPVISDEKAA